MQELLDHPDSLDIDSHDFQRRFFERTSMLVQLHLLFRLVPGMFFFVKDASGRFVAVSPELLRRSGFSEERQMIGRTDHDIYPAHLADAYVRDDRQVLLTGTPLVDKVEVWFSRESLQDWVITTKMPVLGLDGQIIGIMGFVRSHEGQRRLSSEGTGLDKAIEHIRASYKDKVDVASLAKLAGLSTRQLERRFKQVFKLSPQDFITLTRIQSACEALLHTRASVSEIALEHGYCDQSAFSRLFKKHIGQTPKSFRKNHGKNAAEVE